MIDLKLTEKLQKAEKLFFFLTILFLPTQLGKHFWPDFSSIYSLRIDYLSPVVYFWDILVAFLWAAKILNYKKLQERLNLNRLFLLIFTLFLLTQLVSLNGAINPFAGFVRIKEYLVAGLFGLYIASSNLEQIRKIFFRALLLSVFLTSLLAILQFLTGSSLGFWVLGERDFKVDTPLIAKFNFYDKIFLRPYATFPHPNLLAGFLAITLPIVVYALSPALKFLRFLFTLFIASTIFITFSRPGLLVASFFVFLNSKKFWKIWVLIGASLSPIIIVRYASIFTYDSLALVRRQELTDFALKIFKDSPLFGIGLNNFINVLAIDTVLIGTSRFLQPVHNIFLLALSETGVFGFLSLSLFFLAAFFNNLKSGTFFGKVLNGSLLTIIFLGMFDHYFLTLPQGQRIFFLIIGLSLIKHKA